MAFCICSLVTVEREVTHATTLKISKRPDMLKLIVVKFLNSLNMVNVAITANCTKIMSAGAHFLVKWSELTSIRRRIQA